MENQTLCKILIINSNVTVEKMPVNWFLMKRIHRESNSASGA